MASQAPETASQITVTTGKPKTQILQPHLVVSLADLRLKDPKQRYFARFLAHQSLHSEEELSVEVLRKAAAKLSADKAPSQMIFTQRSTQDSEQIDPEQIKTLLTSIDQSGVFEPLIRHIHVDPIQPVFNENTSMRSSFSPPRSHVPFIDAVTFKHALGVNQDAPQAADQLVNLLKITNTNGQPSSLSFLGGPDEDVVIDLRELKRLLTQVKQPIMDGKEKNNVIDEIRQSKLAVALRHQLLSTIIDQWVEPDIKKIELKFQSNKQVIKVVKSENLLARILTLLSVKDLTADQREQYAEVKRLCSLSEEKKPGILVFDRLKAILMVASK